MNSFVRSVVRAAAAVLAVLQLGAGIAAAQGADLAIEKRVFGPEGPIAADAPFEYDIFIFNEGPEPALDVVVTDVLPAGVTFQSAYVDWPEGASCSHDAATNTVTCTLGTLDAFDGTFIALGVVAPATPGTIVNTATVASATSDNESSVATDVVVFNLSDLAVTVTASADAVRVHQAVTFTATVTNNGPEDAAGVRLTMFPPDSSDISLTPSQGACALNEFDYYECLLGPVASGAGATVTMVVTPQNDGFALVSAGVSGYDDPLFFDPDSTNDFASAVVDVYYPGNANPAYPVTTIQVVPYQNLIANCTGDLIYLSGQLRQVVSSTLNRNRFRVSEYTNFNGLTAVNLTDGTRYVAHGGTRTGSGRSFVFNPGLFPREFMLVDNLKLVSGDETILLHQNMHLTVNADGTFTSVVDNPILECK